MSELNLLIECINTEGEAEDGGIKYIYMDADTIYRFENNRMKKISKTLINKARKQIQSQNTLKQLNQSQESIESESVKPAKSKRPAKPKTRDSKRYPYLVDSTTNDDDNDDDNINDNDDDDDEYEQPQIKPKRTPKQRVKSTRNEINTFNPNINLDEYYNNKNKMEYMNLEITRLNNKVDKLKQYKAIVNKLTGNEFDFDIPQTQVAQSQPSYQQLQNTPARNDSLFLY